MASGQVTIAAEVDGRIGYALLTVSVPDVDPVTSWTVEVPAAPPLYDVWAVSSTDVFAVGESGTILHYDGTSWSPRERLPVPDLQGFWGTSAGDVNVVGSWGVILRGKR